MKPTFVLQKRNTQDASLEEVATLQFTDDGSGVRHKFLCDHHAPHDEVIDEKEAFDILHRWKDRAIRQPMLWRVEEK